TPSARMRSSVREFSANAGVAASNMHIATQTCQSAVRDRIVIPMDKYKVRKPSFVASAPSCARASLARADALSMGLAGGRPRLRNKVEEEPSLVISRPRLDLAAENPIRPRRVHEDDRQQEKRPY